MGKDLPNDDPTIFAPCSESGVQTASNIANSLGTGIQTVLAANIIVWPAPVIEPKPPLTSAGRKDWCDQFDQQQAGTSIELRSDRYRPLANGEVRGK